MTFVRSQEEELADLNLSNAECVYDPSALGAAREAAIYHQKAAMAAAHMAQQRGLLDSSRGTYLHRTDPDEETQEAIRILMKRISGRGEIKIVDEFYMVSMSILHDTVSFSDRIKFLCILPDGTKRYFQGPIDSFRGCKTAEDFVMRALEYGGEA